MRKASSYIRIIALMLLMVTLLSVTAYAQEDNVGKPKVDGTKIALDATSTVEEEEVLEGIVLDASGKLWYMPEQIPLTFLTDEEEELIFRFKLYTETDKVLEDTRKNSEIVWDYWYYKTGNAKGVAGLMGNINAESGFRSNNLQGSYERGLGMTDESYTAAVDNGTYKNFVKDSAGYGLVQWTYWTLKRDLLNYAQETQQSIGDIYMQLDFLYYQFENKYTGCMNVICNATTVRQSSNYILLNFERPADQSENAQNRRANGGQSFYDACVGRCAMLKAMKKDINSQLQKAEDRMNLLGVNYNITSLWSNFLSGFYTNKQATPTDMLNSAWDEFLAQ